MRFKYWVSVQLNDLSYDNNKDEDQVVHSGHLNSHYMYYITGISTLKLFDQKSTFQYEV